MPETTPAKEILVADEVADAGVKGPRLRCPKCGYKPVASDLWFCNCLHAWHTFDTGGVCPGCFKQWTETSCPKCGLWSAHSDWYEYN